VEAALRAQAGVLDAAVVLHRQMDGEPRLAAYVVPDGATPRRGEIERRLGERLPCFMVPDQVVLLDALPLTANGKLDRRALPAPERRRSEEWPAPTPPRTSTERALCAVWEDALGMRGIGVHDNFFELGGHSLLATRVLTEMQSRFGRRLSMRLLYDLPTVAELAGAIEGDLRPQVTDVADGRR